jgi:hypothetical protein
MSMQRSKGTVVIFTSNNNEAAEPLSEEIKLLCNSSLLDPVWYKRNYPDFYGDTVVDAARHYLERGAREGRNPHPLFSTKFYEEQNPDVVVSGMNPLVHYILYGQKEGRIPNPPTITDSQRSERNKRRFPGEASNKPSRVNGSRGNARARSSRSCLCLKSRSV